MKKILLSLACLCSLSFANEIDALKAENEMLKEKIKELENVKNSPKNPNDNFYDDVFIDFNKIHKEHEKAMKELNEIANQQMQNQKDLDIKNDFFSSQSTTSRYFQTGDIISTVKQNVYIKNTDNSSKIEFKTYNAQTNQDIKIKDIIKDENEFMDFLKKLHKNNDLSGIILDNFYLDSYGFTFCSNDMKQNIIVSYEDIKPYLKEEFIKLIWE